MPIGGRSPAAMRDHMRQDAPRRGDRRLQRFEALGRQPVDSVMCDQHDGVVLRRPLRDIPPGGDPQLQRVDGDPPMIIIARELQEHGAEPCDTHPHPVLPGERRGEIPRQQPAPNGALRRRPIHQLVPPARERVQRALDEPARRALDVVPELLAQALVFRPATQRTQRRRLLTRPHQIVIARHREDHWLEPEHPRSLDEFIQGLLDLRELLLGPAHRQIAGDEQGIKGPQLFTHTPDLLIDSRFLRSPTLVTDHLVEIGNLKPLDGHWREKAVRVYHPVEQTSGNPENLTASVPMARWAG
jgi:hypothetical protein